MNANQPRQKKGTRSRKKKAAKAPTTTKKGGGGTTTVSKAPVSINVVTKNVPARFRQVRGGFIVTHKEYIGELTTNGVGFAATSYSINPGLSGSFPWLSSIANRFESYLFDDLRYIYEPVCNTTTNGSVMMAIDYDAADPTPSSKAALMSYANATRVSPWARTVFDARRSDLRKFGVQRYVRGTTAPTNTDIKTYDIGNFFAATQGTAAGQAASLGEIYVEYSVRFMTPQISTGVFSQNSVTQAESQYSSIVVPSGTEAVSLTGEYRGSGVGPLLWWDPATATSITPTLIFNLNSLNNMLMSFRSGTGWPGESGGYRALNFFNNIKFGTSVETATSFMWAIKQLVFGFASQNAPNNLFETYLLQGTNGIGNKDQGGIFPLPFKRPTTGSYTVTMAAIPVAANYSGNIPLFSTTGTDYAFPPINIPTFGNFAYTKAGERQQFRDTVNMVYKLNANDDPILEYVDDKVRSKSKWGA